MAKRKQKRKHNDNATVRKASAVSNRKYKDTVFRMIHRRKRELLELYNSLNGTCYTNAEELEIITLDENQLLLRMRNDVSCILDFRMNFYEHQSTWNPNMPLKLLFYVAGAYHGWIKQKHYDLHGKRRIELPSPRFFVFYNGTEQHEDVEVMKLSESYRIKDDPPKLELVVTQYNINEGHNEKLLMESRTLHGYAVFVGKTRRFHDSGLAVDESVKRAVDECIHEHILEDIFRENYEEVVKMGEAEFWEELHYRTMEKELREDLREELKEDLRREEISRLIAVCKDLGVSREKTLEQLKKQYQLDTETAEQSLAECW